MAVCWSSASVRARLRPSSSVKRRTFSIAITAWSAKVSRSAIWLSEKSWTSVRGRVIVPIAVALPHQRNAQDGAEAGAARVLAGIRELVRVGEQIGDVDGAAPPAPSSPRRCRRAEGRTGRPAPGGSARDAPTRRSRSPSRRQIAASNASHSRAALSATVSSTGWTSVGRPRDDAQDLAGHGLLLEGSGQLVIALLPSSWKSRTFSMAMTAWSAKVLTRSICRAVNGSPARRTHPITPIASPSRRIGTASNVAVIRPRRGVAGDGRSRDRAKTSATSTVARPRGGAAHDEAAAGGLGETAAGSASASSGAEVVDRDQWRSHPSKRSAAVNSASHSARPLRDDVEDRLGVGRRARDDPQDLAGGGLLLEGFGEPAGRRPASRGGARSTAPAGGIALDMGLVGGLLARLLRLGTPAHRLSWRSARPRVGAEAATKAKRWRAG